jgi:hypothetical protein
MISFSFFWYLSILGFKDVFAQKNSVLKEKEIQLKVKKSDRENCKVSGKVLDTQDNAIPGINVRFKSNQIEKSIITNDSGGYSINLPTGIFDISIEEYYNYEPFQRAKLNIQCEDELIINIFPFFKRITHNSKGQDHQFSIISKEWIPDKRLNLVISYLNKEKKENTVAYKDAMLTYNNLTISADKLIQNFKSNTIIAEGNIWLEDGKKRTNYEKLTIKFTNNGVEIEGKESSSAEK